jgi:hypothetical protein
MTRGNGRKGSAAVPPETENANAETVGRGARRQSRADARSVRAVHLRTVDGKNWPQIGRELDITPQAAQAAYKRGVLMLVPRDDIETYRELALQKLDIWEQEVLAILRNEHVMVNFGKVVPGVYDDGPKLAAIDRLVKIERERRAIVGYSAPSKRVLEVVGEDAFDRAIRQLNEDAARLERDAELHDQLEAAMRPDGE